MTQHERRWLALLADAAAATASPPAAASPSAAAPPALESLLERACGLLADVERGTESELEAAADGPQRGTQLGDSQRLSGATAGGTPSGDASPSTSGPAHGAPQAGNAPLAILPPSIFGAAASGPRGGPQGPAPSLEDLIGRYSYTELREDPAVADLQDLDPDLAAPSAARSADGSDLDAMTAAAVADGGGASVAGLWPEAALLNHSCCPNGSVLVLGGALYVRAGRALMEGEELTVSYLSKGLFVDVAERRRQLRGRHGFVCCCPRCIAEQEHFPTRRYPELERRQAPPPAPTTATTSTTTSSALSTSTSPASPLVDDETLGASLKGRRGNGPLQRLLDVVFGPGRFRTNVAPDHRLLADVNAALAGDLEAAAQSVLTAASRPRQQQAALLSRLDGLLSQVEASCLYLDLPPRGRLLTYGSVYGLVRLTCDLGELSQQADPERRLELLTLAAEVLEAVAPGSDAHVAAAVKASGVARRVHGAEGAATRRAELAAARAHVARYGRGLLVQPGLLRRMAATRRRQSTGSSLAAAMGVLAWAQHVGAEAGP
ncbi:hypothetical protein GPECTOR_7g1008 [Gonium pectorale]|uniref:SET domain-containing protein n=1 Tax=Gonium pectorale TaxID=33097 RepID=A0A150GTV3_GONPE|nr:hypothetical protein GPECTOR_7g1008 [Gonium pectorale]|eukprot:KXZ53118.1 hypothetical protein GPECTOR_7g1008 [Gonium pectorale]